MSGQETQSLSGSFLQMDSAHAHQTTVHSGWYEYNPMNSTYNVPHNSDAISPQALNRLDNANPKPGRINKRVNPIDRTFFCSECGATFSNSSNLKSHTRIHSGERPYVCDVCGLSFVQSSNMKAHKRTHTGERPFCCEECGQSFSRSSHLTGHKRTHTGERPYICGICNESFVTSTHLRNHMRKHTGERPFSCKICKACFSQNSSLQIHLRIHTGERPYKCTCCSSAFRSGGDLRNHVKLHTDSRPFLCVNCEKSFKTKQYLCKHMKKCGTPPSGKKRGRPQKPTPSEDSPASDEILTVKDEFPAILRKRKRRHRAPKNDNNGRCELANSRALENQSVCSSVHKFGTNENIEVNPLNNPQFSLSQVTITEIKL